LCPTFNSPTEPQTTIQLTKQPNCPTNFTFSPEIIDLELFHAPGHKFSGRHRLSRDFLAVNIRVFSGRTRAPGSRLLSQMCRSINPEIIDFELFRARGQDSATSLKSTPHVGSGLFELDSNRPRDRVPLRIVRHVVNIRTSSAFYNETTHRSN